MCLILNENRSEPIIAPYNIICYKRLDNTISYVFCYYYERNYLNPNIEISVNYQGYEKIINEGYHSRNERSLHSSNRIFMIPKDTKFYIGGENNCGEDNYVSETIILLGSNTWFNRLYFKWKYKLKSYINDKSIS